MKGYSNLELSAFEAPDCHILTAKFLACEARTQAADRAAKTQQHLLTTLHFSPCCLVRSGPFYSSRGAVSPVSQSAEIHCYFSMHTITGTMTLKRDCALSLLLSIKKPIL